MLNGVQVQKSPSRTKMGKGPSGTKMEKGPSRIKMEKGPSGTKIAEQKLSGNKSGCLGDFCSLDVCKGNIN